MTELKPCPFCGCGTIEIDEYERFKCGACGVLLKFPDSPRQRDNAENGLIIDNYDLEWHMAAWNTRAADNATQHTHCCPCGAERTCRNVRKPNQFFACSECRAIEVDGGAGNYTWNYYPNCGAKVEGD